MASLYPMPTKVLPAPLFGDTTLVRARDFSLSGAMLCVALAARNEKSRRGATLPLRVDVAERVREYIADVHGTRSTGDAKLLVSPTLRGFNRDHGRSGDREDR